MDEVARVLKPGGRFFFDEVTATALARPTYQVLFDHPSEDRFTAGEFLHELSHHGLDVGERWQTRIGGITCWVSPHGNSEVDVVARRWPTTKTFRTFSHAVQRVKERTAFNYYRG
ncbi:class I SAM-dependent methyltransferase [Gordonia westfalica]|uniref:class I SAM-dependent methyltransferase n=1 Tax=Gordonia westfalica TaxID=158898 RepID=UPI001FCC62C2|nr:class I SAM-dependent methyltransferase [Gordonia westfalica]